MSHHLGVVLGDLVKLAHGGGNFLQTVALLHARGRNARHAGSHAPNAPSHLGNACAHAADDGGTGLHLLHRGVDEFANLARRFARAPRQHAHFRRHHGKATSLFTGTRGFHRCVERQNIGLKSDAIDHANDFIHAPRTLLDGFHRLHCPCHLLGALVCRLAHLAGTLVSGASHLGIALHGGKNLLHAGGGFFQVGCLLLCALGQGAVIGGQALARVRHQRRVAADVRHHGREREHHAVQEPRQIRQFIAPLGGQVCTQIAPGGLLHGMGQRLKVC